VAVTVAVAHKAILHLPSLLPFSTIIKVLHKGWRRIYDCTFHIRFRIRLSTRTYQAHTHTYTPRLRVAYLWGVEPTGRGQRQKQFHFTFVLRHLLPIHTRVIGRDEGVAYMGQRVCHSCVFVAPPRPVISIYYYAF